jgi:hypothetical protein
MNNNRSLSILSFVFMFVSMVMVILLIFLINRMSWITEEMLKIDSTIVSISGQGSDNPIVTIEYVYEGISYTVRYNTYSSSMREGDIVTIYIDPEYPTIYYQPSIFSYYILPGMMALVFGAVGFPLFFSSRKRNNLKKRLLESGTKIVGKIVDVKTNFHYTMNVGRHRYFRTHITCSIVDEFSDEETLYKSLGFWGPADLDVELGVSVADIWIDRQHPQIYYVDHESIQRYPVESFN